MNRVIRWTWSLVALMAIAGTLQAQVEPEKPPHVAARVQRHVDLDLPTLNLQVGELPAAAADQARQRLARLGINEATARIDKRSGRFVTLLPSTPLVPGTGAGNSLRWESLNVADPQSRAACEQAAGEAFLDYLVVNRDELGIDLEELSTAYKVTSHGDGDLYQIYVPRTFDGIPVRGSYVTAVIGQGNLTLMGLNRWGDRGADPNRPRLTLEEAIFAVEDYLAPLAVTRHWAKSQLIYVPMARGNAPESVIHGRGYRYQLVWSVKVNVDGDDGSWEALVDAYSGEVLTFEDQNQYATVKGGVIDANGVEQAGWPMPYQDTTLGTTDTGGNVAGSGSITATFYGPYVDVYDNCGTDSLTQTDDVDWGTSAGTDCATPGFGGAGNTHASRTCFYWLNRIIEIARSHLPSNSWLQSRLRTNVNINSTCNAYWNGTLNFYRSGGGCSNTGEIAGVIAHQWGHGLDANDATPGISSPSGEGIADVYMALGLNDSCIGRNFRPGVVCGGYGDPCTVCTGVRDIDYLKHESGLPHDFTWRNANCGSTVHCIGYVYSEAVWSLWKRKLQAAPYNYDNNTAQEIVTRLTYIGAGATGTWFSGSPPWGGCAAGNGYLNYLAADDDNGNINDGTPHMVAIYDAFNDQEIACNTPSPVDSGCAGGPTVAPVVTGTPGDKSVGLSWTSVAGATKYRLFRTEGGFQCDFGKVKLGETTGTTWNDNGLQNGREYSYVVIPIGAADPCMGPASACTNLTPVPGPGVTVLTGSAVLTMTSGDGDDYLDNCENATMTFDVRNTGLGTLTNVRLVDVTPSNAGVVITSALPSAVSPSTLAEGQTGSGSFTFTAGGLSPGETLTLQVEVTADQMTGSRFADLTVPSTETDLTLYTSTTYSFEGDAEGWTTIQGTFDRASAGGGAGGSSWYMQSSSNLPNQCDQIQSPVVVFSATTTLSLSTSFDIEPQYPPTGLWYDRANVGIYDVDAASRTVADPDGGRLYNASGDTGTFCTSGENGWAGSFPTWTASTFSATALGSAGLDGEAVQLDVRYGTDGLITGDGFRFDEVTLTDVFFQGPDTQSDICPECTDDSQCDDGVGCTHDVCNENTNSCDHFPMDGWCQDGFFCTGYETCDPVLDCQPGTYPCPSCSCDEQTDECVCPLEFGSVPVDGKAVTVPLLNTYLSPVVIASVRYANNTVPVVTRISKVTATSFDVRLESTTGAAPVVDEVSYLVVDEGVWTVEGVNVEAWKYTSGVTDGGAGRLGEVQSYGRSYANPVVLGQVMSDNDSGWSVFWCQGSERTAAPSASALTTGRTRCEDGVTPGVGETIGVVVIEAGHGTLGGVEYEAGVAADPVRGSAHSPVYVGNFHHAFASAPPIALVTLAGTDGGNACWAQVHGSAAATARGLSLSFEDGRPGHADPGHTRVRVGYVVFGGPWVAP